MATPEENAAATVKLMMSKFGHGAILGDGRVRVGLDWGGGVFQEVGRTKLNTNKILRVVREQHAETLSLLALVTAAAEMTNEERAELAADIAARVDRLRITIEHEGEDPDAV